MTDNAKLTLGEETVDLPVIVGSENEHAIDISKLRAQNGVSNVNHHPYFKVLGRVSTSEDKSVPVGAYEYTLTYTPINPQVPGTELANRAVYVHAADPGDGSSLGATGAPTDGFLSGTWTRVGTSFQQDTRKRFEGLTDDSAGDSREWGDDDDKVGLLVKLNVLANQIGNGVHQPLVGREGRPDLGMQMEIIYGNQLR